MFSLLRGMFALAIWDAPRRRLVLARDRLGQKPLVYRHDGDADRLRQRAEVAPGACPRPTFPRRVDPAGPRPLPDLRLRPPSGHDPARASTSSPRPTTRSGTRGRCELEPLLEPRLGRSSGTGPRARTSSELRATLGDAVREQMVADVPLGAFLSGGIDSTIIVGLMQEASTRPVKTFSIGFDDPAFDESRYAELAARHLGTEHHAFVVTPRAWETLPALARQFDEPFADSSALPDLARRAGDAPGGDGGPDRRRRRRAVRRLRPLPGDRPGPPARPAPGRARARVLGGPVARALPVSSRAKTPMRKVRRLAGGDRRAPETRYLALGLPVRRARPRRPYIPTTWIDALAAAGAARPDEADPALGADPRLRRGPAPRPGHPRDGRRPADLPAGRPPGQGRPGEHGAQPGVPRPVPRPPRRRAGPGDADPPQAPAPQRPFEGRSSSRPSPTCSPRPSATAPRWASASRSTAGSATSSKDELRAVLLDPVSLDRGLFRPEAVATLIDEHVQGRRDHAYRLWALLMLELWFRNHIDAAPA